MPRSSSWRRPIVTYMNAWKSMQGLYNGPVRSDNPAHGRDPMPRLDRLPQINRNNLLMLPVQVNDTAPFTRLTTPLTAARLAIVTTAGLHRRGDRPFGPGEQTYRVIPSDAPTRDLIQSHTSLGFDRVPMMRDPNICFPV